MVACPRKGFRRGEETASTRNPLELRAAILFAILFLILGMTQSAGALAAESLAIRGILVAASSNNVAKGIYAYAFADRKTGLQSLVLLSGLAAAVLVPLWTLN